MPVISRVVSPSKPSAPAMPSHVPEANHVNLNSKATSKPISSVAIHSRCCCRHHKQGNDQKATLKSRSSDSLTKEVHIFRLSFVFFFFGVQKLFPYDWTEILDGCFLNALMY